ncbi:MAG: hypothetical protein JNM56_18660 [Planctomycetia bacterium]|nr:hypothetical protein [Planctomycetia bacterium]
MSPRCLGLLCVLFCLNGLGCMQTRHAELSSVTSCSPAGSCNDATYAERRWWGFWLAQPDGVRP